MEQTSDTARKFTVTITLKSGIQHVMQCDKLTVSHGRLENDLRGIHWENADIDIMHLDFDEVASVVSVKNAAASAA